jgi:hypothetical protein
MHRQTIAKIKVNVGASLRLKKRGNMVIVYGCDQDEFTRDNKS